MRRRQKQQPEHESPHEARIVMAVDAAGVTDEQRPFYLAFARELDLSLRLRWRPAWKSGVSRRRVSRQIPARNLPLYAATWDPETAMVQPPTCPDFSRWTKHVVMKWFARGLSGHKMWLIGEALMRNPNSGPEFSERQR